MINRNAFLALGFSLVPSVTGGTTEINSLSQCEACYQLVSNDNNLRFLNDADSDRGKVCRNDETTESGEISSSVCCTSSSFQHCESNYSFCQSLTADETTL